MISLKITDEIIRRHKAYFVDNKNFKEQLSDIKKEEVLDILKENLDIERQEVIGFCDWLSEEYDNLQEGDSIFIQKPDELKKKIDYAERHFVNVLKKESLGQKIIGKKTFCDIILKAIGYEAFSGKEIRLIKEDEVLTLASYKRRDTNDRTWSAYDFVLELGIKVCPYCNRNYITPLYTNHGRTRGDLDHFLPKKKYPYLSMSIYNLIPCCKVCNSSFKGTEDFSFDTNFNLYEDINVEDLYRFTYLVDSYDSFYGKDSVVEIELEYNDSSDAIRLKNNNNVFHIKDIYQYHSDEVKKLLLKRVIYTEEYKSLLLNQYPQLFGSEKEMIELLTDTVGCEELKNSVLGKMKKDIVNEIGF